MLGEFGSKNPESALNKRRKKLEEATAVGKGGKKGS